MPTKLIKVPENIAEAGRKKGGGIYQDEKYGRDVRVCNSSGTPESLKWIDTVTGMDVGGGSGKKK